jgi:hypothetical protein
MTVHLSGSTTVARWFRAVTLATLQPYSREHWFVRNSNSGRHNAAPKGATMSSGGGKEANKS